MRLLLSLPWDLGVFESLEISMEQEMQFTRGKKIQNKTVKPCNNQRYRICWRKDMRPGNRRWGGAVLRSQGFCLFHVVALLVCFLSAVKKGGTPEVGAETHVSQGRQRQGPGSTLHHVCLVAGWFIEAA